MIAKIYIAYDLYDEDKIKIMNLFCSKLGKGDYCFIPHETEYLHSTIAFIGETEIEKVLKVKELIKHIDINHIKLKISGKLIHLGDGNKHYIVLEIENNNQLISINKKVIEALHTIGLESKSKDYLPHISLGKIIDPNIELEKINMNEAIEIKPKSIAVFKSVDYSKEL